MKIEELKVELNQSAQEVQIAAKKCNLSTPSGGCLMVTPPLNEDFWIIRLPVSENQAIVGFPKFGTIGIGFQKEEEDWNTNLPYCSDCGAEGIYNHIKHNAKVEADKTAPKKEICLRAIQMVIDEAKKLRG